MNDIPCFVCLSIQAKIWVAATPTNVNPVTSVIFNTISLECRGTIEDPTPIVSTELARAVVEMPRIRFVEIQVGSGRPTGITSIGDETKIKLANPVIDP